MNSLFIMSIVRHLLTGVGGWLTAKGYADSGTVETIIGGVMAAVGVIWSLAEKKGREA